MRPAGWLWLLSGLPFSVVLLLAWMYAPVVAVALFAAAIILEQGHVLSPIVLTWTHAPLRRVALARWPEFVLAPALIMAAVFALPLPWVFGLYFAWNIWHFGMQNYGVVALHSRPMTPDARLRTALICVGSTALTMAVVPFFLGPHDTIGLFILTGAAISWQHWLVDIGLSGRVSRHQIGFTVGLLALGCIGFYWMRPFVDHVGTLPVALYPGIHLARWGIGIVHFWVSARIWKADVLKGWSGMPSTLSVEQPQ